MSDALTRRALAAAPAVVSAALAPHPDAEIIAGLHRWCAAVRAYAASPLDGESQEWMALLNVADDAMKAMIPLRPTTIDGLAIKSFMAIRFEYGGTNDNEMMPDFDSSIMTDKSIPTALGADLLRLSPILAAAVA